MLDVLLSAMIQVESGGDHLAVGDDGDSHGCLQIQQGVLDDVNRVYGKQYARYHCLNEETSKKIATLYLLHYGYQYTQRSGKAPTYEVLARIWNGGYEGFFTAGHKTDLYWSKVYCELVKQIIGE